MSNAADKPKNPLIERALEMNKQNLKVTSIARELGVSYGTVRKWFKKAGIPARRNGVEPVGDVDDLQIDLEANLKDHTDNAVRIAKHDARLAEDEAMMELAEAQSTPADKYQHYIAAAGIKLLRDSIKDLKGPRTVRELSELDQLIRRNLGLHAKGGSGGGNRMQIDISILNNAKTDRGDGTVSKMKSQIIDVEPE